MPQLGRYEILRPLAKGGMAEVFLARRRSGSGIEKRLVIKRVRSERAGDPQLMALFVREARVSMALSHQNIVPVFDFGRVDDALFLAMEYVDGRDLGGVLTRARDLSQPMDPALIAFVGAECCAALAYAHGRRFDDGTAGVVHRDVTPRNILLSWSGEVRLTDFGVAALHREDAGAIRGTPSYMAPEQARGDATDGRADLYALGLVLWEAATGTRVRSGEAAAALAEARRGSLPAIPDGVSPPLAEVIARATAADPAERFADGRAMQDALDQVARATGAGRGGAPSRLLADWLRGLYDEVERHELPVDAPAPLEAVTFLDDGEEAVLGSATARSLAGTAADVDEMPLPTPTPAAVGVARRSRAPLLAAALAAAAMGATALAWRGLRGSAPATATDGAPVADAAPARPIDAAPDRAIDAAVPPDAAPAPSPDAGRPRPPHDAGRPRPPPPDAAAAAIRRQVTIGARPWATFYVDGDATRHETPETLVLAPGRHRIRFVNEQAHVDRTITLDVPADRDIKHVEVLTSDPP